MTDTPPVVQLVAWTHQRVTAGDAIPRYSLVHEGRYILTFGSELEARRAAERYGWRVEAVNALAMPERE